MPSTRLHSSGRKPAIAALALAATLLGLSASPSVVHAQTIVIVTPPAYGPAPEGMIPPPTYAPYGDAFYPAAPALDPDVAARRVARARRALGIERATLALTPVGATALVAGAVMFSRNLCFEPCAASASTDPRLAISEGLLASGATLYVASVVTGAASGIAASNQLRRLGVARHRRGLAIAALALSLYPAYGLGYLFQVLHYFAVRRALRNLPVQTVARHGPSFGVSSFVDPRSGTVGSRLTIAF